VDDIKKLQDINYIKKKLLESELLERSFYPERRLLSFILKNLKKVVINEHTGSQSLDYDYDDDVIAEDDKKPSAGASEGVISSVVSKLTGKK
jgi:hypothetical protein